MLDANALGGTAAVLLFLAALVLLVLWVALPFALFGLKGLLRQLLHEQRTANAHLRALVEQLTRK